MVGSNRGRQNSLSLSLDKGNVAAGPNSVDPIVLDLTTLAELLAFRSSESGSRVAFRFVADGSDARSLTYRELYLKALGVAAELEERGLAGERALLLYPAGLDFIVAFFGCLLAGVVAVPAYPPRKNRHTERLSSIVKDAEAKILLSTADSIERMDSVVAQDSVLRTMRQLATDSVAIANAPLQGTRSLNSESLAFLQYTSGSTGQPKGVMLTHGNLLANLARIATGFGTSERDVLVSWLPLYHDMGLIGGVLQPIYAGFEANLFAPAQFLQRPLMWLQTISETRATISGGPNFAYELCLNRIPDHELDELDLSRWEVAFNGAEPIRAATLDRFACRFARCGFRDEAFYPCYGLAEATLLATGGSRRGRYVTQEFNLSQSSDRRTPGVGEGSTSLVSCGSHFAGHEVRIVDPDTVAECLPGEIGEIWIAGPSVSQGYWNQPRATQETFGARLPGSSRRYLRTGDLGALAEGELFVTGRLKETIIVRGVNYFPADIEQAIDEACADLPRGGCAAFAIPTDGGEELAIAVESTRHHSVSAKVVADRVSRQLAESHGITPAVTFVVGPHSLPRTSSGKLQRLACLKGIREEEIPLVDEWHRDDAAFRKPAAQDEVGALVVDLLSQRLAVAPGSLTLATPLSDLGLDSLAWMEVVSSLEEQLGVQLPEADLASLSTIGGLVVALQKNDKAGTERRRLARGDYDFAHSPEYLRFKENLRLTQLAGVANPYFTVHEGTTADRTIIEGRAYLNFCSYNYLGMSGDPAVTRAAQGALARYGSSVSASRLVSGEKPIHSELEAELADWLGVDAAITFVGGHATNVSTIGHLFGPGDLVLHDALAHNSIVQGCRLSGAQRRAFCHNDPTACEQILRRLRSEYRRVLIAVEGVYSMDGDVAPLPEFVRLKEQYKCYLMVDEAHSLGTIGPRGQGIAAHYDLDPRRVDLWMGTLSKSLGSCGGYIAASSVIVEYLRYTAPGFVYSVGMTPANTAAALAALRQLERHPDRVERLQQNSAYFLELAGEHGLDTGKSAGTPIVPVITGSSIAALQLAERLFQEGINVQPILHPAVEEHAARLRFFITSDHTRDQIERAVVATARHWRVLQQQTAAA